MENTETLGAHLNNPAIPKAEGEKESFFSRPQTKELSDLNLTLENWGEIPYKKALQRQWARVEQLQGSFSPSPTKQRQKQRHLIFCSHPPVVTLGRGTQKEHLTSWEGEKVKVERGGSATYHGPGQVVVYPIMDLRQPSQWRKAKDILSYLRHLEQAVVESLQHFDLTTAQGKNEPPLSQGRKPLDTGVWIGNKKIASLGIAVRRWITFHGLAINLYKDPQAFKGIQPCGINPSRMVSLEDLLGYRLSRASFNSVLLKHLLKYLY